MILTKRQNTCLWSNKTILTLYKLVVKKCQLYLTCVYNKQCHGNLENVCMTWLVTCLVSSI